MASVDVKIINLDTRDHVEDELIRVERKPSETDAYFLAEGTFMVVTSNGESYCEGPVWILWDTSGYPYPITPEEFAMLYTRKPS
jgi:hypothetical protein